MSFEMIGLLGVVILLVLLATRMWIGAAMIFVGFVGIALIRGFDQGLSILGGIPYQQVAFYPMSVMPMFVLMGYIISETNIGTDLFYTTHKWLGWLRGGLAIATAGACALLAAITGGSMTGIIIMSKVALPEMQKYNYDDRLSTGVIAASATMGALIPPSMIFIMYGILTEQSVGLLFMAGIIPGILEAVFYMVVIYILCRINPMMGPAGPKTSFKEKIYSIKHTWAVLTLFILVMGGIYGGVFTPTEAGAVGAMGSIIIATASRRLTWSKFLSACRETAVMSGMILMMIVGVFIYATFTAISQFPFWLGDIVAGLNVPKIAIIIAIIIMYIIAGCFIPSLVAIVLTIPIIYPVILALDFNPIWFGVIIVRMLEIGQITPPMGINVFILGGITGLPIGTIYRGIIPFVIADFAHVALLVAVPAVSLFIPNMMMQ